MSNLLGVGGIVVLPSVNFLVISSIWDNGSEVDASAVAFVNAHSGMNGAVSAANSLVGGSADDQIGIGSIDLQTNDSWDPTRERLAVGRSFAVSFLSYEAITFDGFE